jgi:hypothetical protein
MIKLENYLKDQTDSLDDELRKMKESEIEFEDFRITDVKNKIIFEKISKFFTMLNCSLTDGMLGSDDIFHVKRGDKLIGILSFVTYEYSDGALVKVTPLPPSFSDI